MNSRRARFAIVASVLAIFSAGSLFALWMWNINRVHQHCMMAAGMALVTYASDHNGAFPQSTNGFGDALVLLAASGSVSTRCLVGVGDDGSRLGTAMTNNTHLPEEACTRIYVQGLSTESNPEIALFFDRYAVRGGDHHRWPFAQYLREVWTVGSRMQGVTLNRWPAFASNQVEMLVTAGIPRETAEAYYKPTLSPDARR